MRDECEHGSLRRSCQICDRDEDIADMRKRIAELEQNQKDLHQRFTQWRSETPEASFDEWMKDPATHWTCEEDAAWQAWQHLFEEVIFDMRERISELEKALSLVKQWDIEQATETFMKSGKPMQFQLPRAVREQIQTLLQEES